MSDESSSTQTLSRDVVTVGTVLTVADLRTLGSVESCGTTWRRTNSVLTSDVKLDSSLNILVKCSKMTGLILNQI